MASFLLRDADDDLWEEFKARAARDGRKLNWIVLTLITYYIRHGMPAEPVAAAGKKK